MSVGSATGRSSVRRLDPDELAALEDERDHLLGSLEDLEREHDAGDLDDLDYRTLKDDYTHRAAEVLRAIDDQRELLRATRRSPHRGRTVAVVVGVLAFAVLTGVLVARGAGIRGGGTLTGNDGTLTEELADCQPLAFSDPAEGVECYDTVLELSPDNPEALTYQGWALIRDGRVDAGTAQLDRVVALDPDYPDARVFLAIVAARDGEAAAQRGDAAAARTAFERAAAEIDRFYDNEPPQSAIQVLQQELLEFKVFLGLLDAPTQQCWASTLSDRRADAAIDQAFLDQLGACLDGVLAASPDDVDALNSRALALIGPDRADLPGARARVEQALAVAPDDGDARLLRAFVAIGEGRFDEAEADLDVLADRPRPSSSFLVGSPAILRRTIEAARRAATSTTTTTPPGAPRATPTTRPQVSVSTVPGAPVIPNADGG